MKKLFYLTILLIISCTTYKPMTERVVSTEVYDLREYIKSGFFITTNPYYSKYEPVGLIDLKIYPKDVEKIGTKEDHFIPNAANIKYYTKENISKDECLKLFVAEAKKLGANGICNFEATTEMKTGDEKHLFLTIVNYYHLKGFAIKINQN